MLPSSVSGDDQIKLIFLLLPPQQFLSTFIFGHFIFARKFLLHFCCANTINGEKKIREMVLNFKVTIVPTAELYWSVPI